MNEPQRKRPRAARKAAVLAGTGAADGLLLPDILRALGARLRAALSEESEQARLAPWLAAGFCGGVLLYFVAPREPLWLAAFLFFWATAWLSFALRARPAAWALATMIAAIAAGFATGAVRGAMVSHPVLTAPTATVTLAGFVENRDSSTRSDRIVLRVTKTDPKSKQQIPERVRVAFRKGIAPAVGEHVELRARLRPLVGPIRPGGYDFAVGAYYAGLGATGFALGKSKQVAAGAEVPLAIRFNAAIDGLRRSLAERIRLTLPGDAGAIAAALVTGIRDHISNEANEAMRISGLYHVISISGLHMALVAGVLFAVIRGGLALIPGLALRRPIKKYAAVLALLGVTFYLVLSGGEVATQRSYIMIAIVLLGVLIDRPALTLRTLSGAVVVTLLISPEAILNPGFQMSFAATLALIGFYERAVPFVSAPPPQGASALGGWAARAGRWVLLGAATSFIAGLATAIYAAFHFHRLAPYGVLANVLSMPLIGLVIMPGALVGVLLLPFGFDFIGWTAMGYGIEGMMRIATFVSGLRGAEGRIAAFGVSAVLLGTAALLILTLPATRLRLIGVPVALLAMFLMWNGPRYDILIDAEGDVVALRMADGKLAIYTKKSDRFTTENWLAAAGLPPADRKALAEGFSCDAKGCTGRLRDGTLIAIPKNAEALLEDCGRAALVISQRRVPSACASAVIDREVLASTGALALQRTPAGWKAIPSRSPDADRPWFGRAKAADGNAFARLNRPETKQAVPLAPPAEISGEVPAPDAPEEEPANQ
ncbi:MAG: ComEC/Rec2 family competence protein [Xanthobacteraceae bacterium]|nr:ComEC/Rec2 family competence protein [Xanthobacteraceae bacterium]